MLEYLRIRDLALIENAELEFCSGMNVLTGETGAGKSFILKAINFLLGEKLSNDAVRNGAEKAQVEALFSLNDQEYIIRRELLAESSRSRLFINDKLSSQDSVKDLKQALILHASQHGQQKLLQASYHIKIVDFFLEDKNLLFERDEILKQVHALEEEYKALIEKTQNLEEKRELLEMQQQEIHKVAPRENEDIELDELRANLRNFEHIEELYENSLVLLKGDRETASLLDIVHELERNLHKLIKIDAEFGTELEVISNFKQSIIDLEKRLRIKPNPKNSNEDPEKIDARLFQLSQLKRKLKRTLPEIMNLKNEIENNLSFLDICTLDKQRLQKELSLISHTLQVKLNELNIAREKAAIIFKNKMEEELSGLGFSEKVQIMPEFTDYELYKDCLEKRVRIFWCPNPGQAPQPLDRIASGGELSRFLLALTSLQAKEEMATLIFDEVDSGVGGITLNKVGDRLEKLAQDRQMLLITHWANLAKRAERHFLITKQEIDNVTISSCKQLTDIEIQYELERMTGNEIFGIVPDNTLDNISK